jgi:hypothetical protein
LRDKHSQGVGYIGTPRAERRRRFREMRRHERLRAPRSKRVRASKHLVGDDAECIKVGAVIGVPVADRLLGRHVRGRPQGHAGRRQCGRARGALLRGHRHGLGDSKVGDYGVPAREEHVLGLQVSVHDAPRMSVC